MVPGCEAGVGTGWAGVGWAAVVRTGVVAVLGLTLGLVAAGGLVMLMVWPAAGTEAMIGLVSADATRVSGPALLPAGTVTCACSW